MVVAEPYEFWDMADGETRRIRVVSWEIGDTEISPRYLPDGGTKTIRVLRLHLAEGIKPLLPSYWDITSKHLQAALIPYLEAPAFTALQFDITKHGEPPRARFSMTVART